MQFFAGYIVRLSAAAIAVGILLSIVSGGKQDSLFRLLCGIFLTVTALSPFLQYDMPDISDIPLPYFLDADQSADYGLLLAENMKQEIIKEKTEAYISDKAQSHGVALDVYVFLNDNIPSSVILEGTFRPEEKTQLSEIIANELGIEKENQQWIGQE